MLLVSFHVIILSYSESHLKIFKLDSTLVV